MSPSRGPCSQNPPPSSCGSRAGRSPGPGSCQAHTEPTLCGSPESPGAWGTFRVTRQKIWWLWWLWTQVMSAKEASKSDPGMFSGTWARHTVPSAALELELIFRSTFQQLLWISRRPRLTRCPVRNDSIQTPNRTCGSARPRWRWYHRGPRQCVPAAPACLASTPPSPENRSVCSGWGGSHFLAPGMSM